VNPSTPTGPDFYRERAQRYAEQAARFQRLSGRISNLRGAAFALFLVAGGLSLFGSWGWPGAVTSALSLFGFVALALWHARVIAAQDISERWLRVNGDATDRVDGTAWHRLPNDGSQFRDSEHPYTDDLDLFGPGSLFLRLSVAHTYLGQARLADWLSRPAAAQELEARQATVASLSSDLEFRQRFEVLALGTFGRAGAGSKDAAKDPEPLLRWAEGTPELARRKALVLVARLLPVVTAAVLLGSLLHHLPAWSVAVALGAQGLVLFLARPPVSRVLAAVGEAEGMLTQLGPLLGLIEDSVLHHPERASLVRLLGDQKATLALSSLSRILGWFDLRHQGLVYPFVDLALLWDVHCTLALEGWQVRHGRYLRDWFGTVAEVEALSSFAGFAYDESDTCFAEILDQDGTLSVLGLGHPLIPSDRRVRNDVDSLTSGHALLVTGSNMSGKSTFLRSLGLAVVLGLAGAPVCARRLRLSRLRVATSMRVRDSLAEGISSFYAELLRLKAVLEAARNQPTVLFLLDELLHGTNSVERQAGARWLIGELLEARALGALSTHDQGLCDVEGELAERLELCHFRESVEDSRMKFDFRLRPGPVSGGNALQLMRELGLAVPVERG